MTLTFLVFLVIRAVPSEAVVCSPGEYAVHGECCPMCSPGQRVQKHCNNFSSTSCIPCVGNTYTDHPNGLEECRRCKFCDEELKLIIKEKCVYTRNTVCGCREGYFCRDFHDEDCEMCQKRTICPPGFRVSSPGTVTSDHVCEICPKGTFSAANMSMVCTPWTRCEDSGMVEVKAGTSASDAGCGRGRDAVTTGAVTGLIILVLLLIPVAVFLYWRKKKKRKQYEPRKPETEGLEKGEEALVLVPENGREIAIGIQETASHPGVLGL
ncbi:tumor necrosis factor receptor superfamily member 14 isoform X1 [Alligator mississippiensis]|uniref:tumor necrosis factor receptor superfamily member 14 isoform X1 n=2 Tax=Alligator mississippiensis TaxID=8496 RepID=UPI002877F986|nr:tumor necrosis factor receptor superfamily member 14 isoform X1 [Alligator mississippiensis]